MIHLIQQSFAVALLIACASCSHLPTKIVAKAMNNQETIDNIAYLKQYTQAHLSQAIHVDEDIAYGTLPSQKLDVVYPEKMTGHLPVVFWVHGGGWVAGSKQGSLEYVKLIADRGFIVVNIEYTLVPHAHFPQQVTEINQAVEYVLKQPFKWNMDSSKVFFAGDSAGANLVTNYVSLITTPDLAQSIALQSPLNPTQLKGMVLHSGVYDLNTLYNSTQAASQGFIRWTGRGVIADLSGEKRPTETTLNKMSATPWVNKAFPPVFLTASANDLLTEKQSLPFVEKLKQNGVRVDAHIYPKDYKENLNHDFNFNLRFQASQDMLEQSIQFLLNKSK
ncbi:alpha/beta hydrolase [Acinetobacter sp. MD2(2019)]|uniref:alpha/beta hydrolase n=1 Tax=Acinetobacter sp. MD2(2019) TaxID=2605273 RepID=UPI002D1F8D0F|nr:alpha/beta hydrolase [Acinetobacter sp. MD2(2019)]MEB3754916.1 alpha/beta hydrolase [Acinetobacter sp. MD2(2019)]